MLWLQLIICILIIVLVGRKVAHYGDIIAVKTGIGGLWIGLVLLSVTTSLPELFNGVSAILIVDQPDLTVGNLLGASTFNLLNLAVLDAFIRHHSIMQNSGWSRKLTGWFSLVMFLSIGVSLLIQPLWNIKIGWIGWTIPIIMLLYFLFVRKIALVEKHNSVNQEPSPDTRVASLKRTLVLFVLCAALIVGAGIWLATLGDQVAEATGLGQSFIGSILIGLITTLPEITVSFSALRIGAVDMAVSNMIGSNMFNMFLVCIDELIYTRGSILAAVSPNNLITVSTALGMTLITIAALYFKPVHRFNWYNLLIFAMFIAGGYLNFMFS